MLERPAAGEGGHVRCDEDAGAGYSDVGPPVVARALLRTVMCRGAANGMKSRCATTLT